MRVQAWNQQLPLARLSCFRLNDDKATPGGAVKVWLNCIFSCQCTGKEPDPPISPFTGLFSYGIIEYRNHMEKEDPYADY